MPSVVTGVTSLGGHATIAVGEGETPGTDAVRLLSQGPLPYDGPNPQGFYSSVDWVPQTDFTFSQLTNLRASYKGEIGTFGGGGPRFSIFFDWNNNGTLDDFEINEANHMFVVWGTDSAQFRDVPDYNNYADTGNFVGTTNHNWDISQLGDGYPYRSYDDALAQPSRQVPGQTVGETIANLRILAISIVLDSGWSMGDTTSPANTQSFLIDHVLIEGFVPDAGGAAFSAASGGAFSERLVATASADPGPTIGKLAASPGTQTRAGKVTLAASNIVDPNGHAVTGVEFFRDSNHSGVLDANDESLGNGALSATGKWVLAAPALDFDLGVNRFFAVAQNDVGSTGDPATATSTITNAKPTISSLAGKPNPIIQGDILTLTASGVADADGSVQAVEFYRDTNGNGVINPGADQLLGTLNAPTATGWKIQVPSGALPLGNNKFLVRAIDNDGGISATKASTVYVNLPPSIGSLMASPSSLARGQMLTLSALNVTDPFGHVVSVSFYRDTNNNGVWDSHDTKLGIDTNGADGWSWQGSTSSFPLGTSRLFAVAKDDKNALSQARIGYVSVT